MMMSRVVVIYKKKKKRRKRKEEKKKKKTHTLSGPLFYRFFTVVKSFDTANERQGGRERIILSG